MQLVSRHPEEPIRLSIESPLATGQASYESHRGGSWGQDGGAILAALKIAVSPKPWTAFHP